MIKASVYNMKGDVVKEQELNPALFGVAVKPEVVTQAVVAQQANAREAIAHVKDRSQVRGGGKKPWRQKGTGRARHGSIRSPLWRGGGVTFGPTNERNFSLKINKKMKRKALAMTLSDKAANQKVMLLDVLTVSDFKTKKFYEVLKNLKLRATATKTAKAAGTPAKSEKKQVKKLRPVSVLVVLPKSEQHIIKAARNIDRVKTILADSVNVVDILKHQYILMPLDALSVMEKTFVK